MARLVDPRSLRYGTLFDWNASQLTLNNQYEDVYKDVCFLDYLEVLMTSENALKEGILYDSSKLYVKNKKKIIEIFLYDGQQDNLLSVKDLDDEVVLLNTKVKYAIFEKEIILNAYKYYGMESIVYFYKLDGISISSNGIARYISVKLKQGFGLGEVVSEISKNATLLLKEEDPLLYGYRIDCSGRFTKKQRTSYKSYKEGQISLNKITSYIDYGCQRFSLKYGACSVKVWMNKSYRIKKYMSCIRI